MLELHCSLGACGIMSGTGCITSTVRACSPSATCRGRQRSNLWTGASVSALSSQFICAVCVAQQAAHLLIIPSRSAYSCLLM